MTLEIRNQTIQLLNERAFYWTEQKILGLSDVHLGKAQSLQRQGIPLSSDIHQVDYFKLTKLIQHFKPAQVLILGDFIHQKDSWTPRLINELHKFFKIHADTLFTLIIGNHERGSLKMLKQFPMLKLQEGPLAIGPFFFAHGHVAREITIKNEETSFVFEGHLHPVVRLKHGPTSLRLPCFVLEENSLLIPSFGELTGGYEISPRKSQRLFAVYSEDVFEVPASTHSKINTARV